MAAMKLTASTALALVLAAGPVGACDWRCTAQWYNSDPSTRITAQGPTLSAYGAEGASGMEAVSRCKFDVAQVVQDNATRVKFDKMCYRLYRADVREQIYKVDHEPPLIHYHEHRTNEKPR